MNELMFEDMMIIEEPEIEIKPIYNTHYIEIDEQNRIIKGWSDAFSPVTDNSIIINDKGGYQFRLQPDGEENPNLFTIDMIPLYKYENDQIITRTDEEIEQERQERPTIIPPKTKLEILEENQLQQDLVLTELYENQLTQDAAICELYELMEVKSE